MSSKVPLLDIANDQCDVTRSVADAVVAAAALELLVFDVVTQQLILRVPPLDRQLGELLVILVVVGTRQADHVTWLGEHSNNTAWRHEYAPWLCATLHLEIRLF